jgi:isopentenyl-diphosphate Delta-isomerase
MPNNEVIVVNSKDEPIGTMDKMEVHQKGILHRAFSVFILNNDEEMLLQQRAEGKYHSAGLWTNACCSHPYPGEGIAAAAHRRLREEMGFDCQLVKLYDFIYKEEMRNGLIEHEFDHVFLGIYNGSIDHAREEVRDYGYLSFSGIRQLLKEQPERFTTWFKIAFPEVECLVRSLAVVY